MNFQTLFAGPISDGLEPGPVSEWNIGIVLFFFVLPAVVFLVPVAAIYFFSSSNYMYVRTPRELRHYRLISLGKMLSPVLGFLAGVGAYFHNNNDPNYLFSWTIPATLLVLAICMLWTRYEVTHKIYKKNNVNHGKIFSPKQ